MTALRSSAVVLFALAAPLAQADLVVNNLDQAYSGGGTIDGEANLASATRFTVGAGLWQINSFAIQVVEGSNFSPDQVRFEIRTDAGPAPSTSVLTTLSTNSEINGQVINHPYTPDAPLTLAAGNYWLVAVPTDPFAIYYWSVTGSAADHGVNGWSIGDFNLSSGDGGTTWNANGAEPGMFSIDATLVPAPGAAALLGLAGLLSTRRKR